MKITNKFKAAVSAFKTTNNTIGSNIGNDFLRYGNRREPLVQDWAQLLMADEDIYTGYGYAAINNRANSVAQLATYNLKTDANRKIMENARSNQESVFHPYLELIDNSNTFSNYKFWYAISTYLDLEGVYFLFVLRNQSGQRVGNPQEFKLLNPYEVKRVRDPNTREIAGYIERQDGLFREIPPHMIIEISRLNPFSRDDPYAMADASKEAQFTLKQAGDKTRQSLQHDINAPGIITVGGDVTLDPQKFENFKARILGHTKGEPIFGSKGSVEWNDMNVDLTKAALEKVNEISLNSLIAVTGNSKTMFGIEQSGVTRDTADVQKDLFVANHTMPQLQLVIDALNQDYKTNYPNDYKKNSYRMYIDSPLGVDRDAELKDVDIRVNSFALQQTLIDKGYDRNLAARYAAGEITLEELGEPANEPAGASSLPATEPDQSPDAQPSIAQQAVEHSHDHIPAIKNEFDEQSQGSIQQQQGALQNVIVGIQARVVTSVLNKITKNAFEDQSDIISASERKEHLHELGEAIALFYGLVLPLYGKATASRRAKEFGLFSTFKLNPDVKQFIKLNAEKASESHINTILEDLRSTIQRTYDNRVDTEIEALLKSEASKLSADEASKLLAKPVSKSSEIYKLAQKKALEGAGQQEIISSIRKEYGDISKNRAKVIAKSETNRVFTMSQYEADLQFIKQNNLEGRAYKKWVTRSNNPCQLCLAEAAKPPIPFKQAFYSLGDEATVTYELDGKTRVLRQKINYETVEAGNLHTNCGCVYQLIIENEA